MDAGDDGTGTGTETGETGGDDLPAYEWDGEPGPASLFTHGIASGDPLSDSIILWTRITPDQADAELYFEVALDPEFQMRVAADYLGAPDASRDNTFKLDLDALTPATTYYYRFWIQGVASPIGRTRTAPRRRERSPSLRRLCVLEPRARLLSQLSPPLAARRSRRGAAPRRLHI